VNKADTHQNYSWWVFSDPNPFIQDVPLISLIDIILLDMAFSSSVNCSAFEEVLP